MDREIESTRNRNQKRKTLTIRTCKSNLPLSVDGLCAVILRFLLLRCLVSILRVRIYLANRCGARLFSKKGVLPNCSKKYPPFGGYFWCSGFRFEAGSAPSSSPRPHFQCGIGVSPDRSKAKTRRITLLRGSAGCFIDAGGSDFPPMTWPCRPETALIATQNGKTEPSPFIPFLRFFGLVSSP